MPDNPFNDVSSLLFKGIHFRGGTDDTAFDPQDIVFDDNGRVIYSPENKNCFETMRTTLQDVLKTNGGNAVCQNGTFTFKDYQVTGSTLTAKQEAKLYQLALKRLAKKPQDWIKFLTTLEIAEAMYKRGASGAARKVLKDQKPVASRSKDAPARVENLIWLSASMAKAGMKNEALQLFQDAILTFNELGDNAKVRVRLLYSLGARLVESYMGPEDESAILEAMISIAKDDKGFTGDVYEQVMAFLACANTSLKLGRTKQADELAFDAAMSKLDEIYAGDPLKKWGSRMFTLLAIQRDQGCSEKITGPLGDLINNRLTTLTNENELAAAISYAADTLTYFKLEKIVLLSYYNKLIEATTAVDTDIHKASTIRGIAFGAVDPVFTSQESKDLLERLRVKAGKIKDEELRNKTLEGIKKMVELRGGAEGSIVDLDGNPL